jgi:serine/threonine protein kinase
LPSRNFAGTYIFEEKIGSGA